MTKTKSNDEIDSSISLKNSPDFESKKDTDIALEEQDPEIKRRSEEEDTKKGFNCFGIDVKNAKTKRLTTVDSQMVVAKGMTTNNPAIRSFFKSCWSLAVRANSFLGVDCTNERSILRPMYLTKITNFY